MAGVALLLAVGGCTAGGADADAVPPAQPTGSAGAGEDLCAPSGIEVDAAAIRGATSFDYQGYETLTETVERVDVAVVGRVAGWRSGTLQNTGGRPDRPALLVIDVLHAATVAGDDQRTRIQVVSGRTIPALPPGATPAPTPTSGPLVAGSLENLTRAAPVGTCVIVAGAVRRNLDDDLLTAPDGSPMIGPYPQGFLLQTAGGGVTSVKVPDDEIASWTANAAASAGNEAATPAAPGSFQNLVDELVAAG
ncbi:MAG TPA: hypothetical protein VGE77_01140 [Nocardioides sp.]